ncbi:hypothetical protein SAMN05446635_0060 [Burkholderia sp. OK233]|nr:hypothetical protein SAMN05446635_0060 [Burkholderia sp. OK233]
MNKDQREGSAEEVKGYVTRASARSPEMKTERLKATCRSQTATTARISVTRKKS